LRKASLRDDPREREALPQSSILNPAAWYFRAMRYLTLALVFIAACANEPPPPPAAPTDTRESIGVMYVGAPEVSARAQANDTAEVIAKYPIGDAVSVLAK